ncbi:hypothetical protein LCGC14_2256920 [marine sediment metagenome]|uniref:Uncharacterized protein n=1 Tax=marine sediment metagenome TaxID=412755 RepID=A0A0F9D1A5_9ZZZZ
MKKSIDIKLGKAIFCFNGKDIEVSLNGITKNTYTHLALIGIHELLSKRKDPGKAWRKIKTGQIGHAKTKPIPLIIRAVAHVYGKDIKQSQDFYSILDKKQKMKLRNDTRIKRFLAENEKETTIELSELVA